MSAEPFEPEPEYDHGNGIEPKCLVCGGEGFVEGSSFGDPLWYDEDAIYPCKSCGGSGLAKDMTFW